MAINITVYDADGDGKGINFSAYLKNFAKTYHDADGRGDFNGLVKGQYGNVNNPMRADGYVTNESNENGGRSVLFESKDGFSYDFMTHIISGKVTKFTFGTDTILTDLGKNDYNIEQTSYTHTPEVSFSGFKPFKSSTVEGIVHDILEAHETGLKELQAFLNTNKIVFNGSDGDDVFTGFKKADKLFGGDGNDKLNGGKGNDKLFGDDGNDKLNGGQGNDKIEGGAGNDILKGGKGADTFIFRAGDGNDTIKDFEAGAKGKDVLAFDDELFSSYTEVLDAARETAQGVVIDFDGGSVLLKGVSLSSLDAGDFDFI